MDDHFDWTFFYPWIEIKTKQNIKFDIFVITIYLNYSGF